MPKATQPCRQLNSKTIKGACLCYLSPIIAGKCSIVVASCSSSSIKERQLFKAWSNICKLQDTCDTAISGIRNVAFFFSAVSTQEGKSKQTTKKEDENDTDTNSEDELMCSGSSQRLGAHASVLSKQLLPTIMYWIALTTPNGAAANPLVVLKALLECGVEADARQVPFKEGVESTAMKELYKVLKDHKNAFMQDLVTFSYQHCFRTEAQVILDDSLSMSQAEDECGTENVVRIKCVLATHQRRLSHALGKIMEAKLKVDVLGISTESETQPSQCADQLQVERRLSDKLTVLINDIDIAMKNLKYGLYRGKVYRKVNRAKYAFAFKCEARAFVNSLATNEFYKARLLANMRKVIDIMSDPYCEVICPLAIDYDLIEVNDGKCWSIKGRKFIECPIPEPKIGQVTPRAFCQYDSAKEPAPKYFQEILENSLDDQQQAQFCEDFLKLLHYNQKHHKDKVPCLVGASNSGKSSLFFPILGIIHHSNIATITKQRAFNKAMITKTTEVVFIDEATESTLSIDDWKVLTQGGFAAFDVKYETARAFINRCPMLITAQRKFDFGGEDQKAMDGRLRTYTFKSLPHPKKRAADWLKHHPMDCIVWASSQARLLNEPDDEVNSSLDEGLESCDEEGALDESEKEALRAFSPVEPRLISNDLHTSADKSSDELNSQESETDDRVVAVQTVLKNTTKDTLRYRQVQELLAKEKERIKENQRCYKRKQDRYKNFGVSTQNLDLVPKNSTDPDPTPIALELVAFAEQKEMAQQKTRQQTSKNVFEDVWLKNTEVKLHDCVITYNQTINPDTKSGAKGMIELSSNKLKLHHKAMGTWKWPEALVERRRTCTALGLLDKQDHQLVYTLSQPLPYTKSRRPPLQKMFTATKDDILKTTSKSSQGTRTAMKRKSENSQDFPNKKNASLLSFFKNYFKK